MSQRPGKDFLIKAEDPLNAGTYTTIAGMRSASRSTSAEYIDGTDADSAEWKEDVPGAGMRSMSASFAGTAKDAATVKWLEDALEARTPINLRIIDVTLNKYKQGAFRVTKFDHNGDYTGPQLISMSLESTGAISNGP